MNIPFLQDTTFTGLISTSDYGTSQEWSDAYTVLQANSADWNIGSGREWGTITGILSSQSDLWAYLSAETFSPSQLTAFLATNNLTLCSIDVKGQLLSGGTNLFDIFLTSGAESQTLSYIPSSYELSISNSNTVNLSSINSTFASNSGKYEEVYTTVQQGSSNWYSASGAALDAAKSYTHAGFLPLSGGTITGDLTVNSNLSVLGTTTYIDTSVAVTSAMYIDTNSTETALRITQRGTGDVLRVEDSDHPDVTPFIINNAGLVGIGTASPNVTLTVAGNLSANAGNFSTLSANNGTLTASAPVLDLAQTWNNAATTFVALNLNVTETTPAGGDSLVFRLQRGGSTLFSIRRDGICPNDFQANGLRTSDTNTTGATYKTINSGSYEWSSTTSRFGASDVILRREDAGVLTQRNGLNAQTFRLYNRFIDASNYQRSTLSYQNSALVIGTEYTTTAGNSALSAQANPIILAPGYNQSLSATAPVILQQTWNNANNTFTLLSANVIDTASNASSLLANFQVNSNTTFSITKGNANLGKIAIRCPGGDANDYSEITQTPGSLSLQNFRNGNILLGGNSGLEYAVTSFRGRARQSLGDSAFGWQGLYLCGSASSNSDTILLRDAANTLAQQNSTNPQEFRLYGTYTAGTPVSSEYLSFRALSASSFVIGPSATGFGQFRNLELQAGGSTRMTVTSAGNVGIGTTTPLSTQRLSVSGNSTFIGNISSTGVIYASESNSNEWRNSKTITTFTATQNQPPSASFATLDTRNSIAVLDFDDTAVESAIFLGIIPEGTNLTSGLAAYTTWMATSATTGNVVWRAEWMDCNATDLDADSFALPVSAIGAANGVSGITTTTILSTTNTNGLSAGDVFRLRISRVGSDGTNDTMSGDAELVAVEIRSAA